MIWDDLDPQVLAFAGDWHGNSRYAEYAIEWCGSRGANVLVHVGDFGYQFTPAFLGSVSDAAEDAGLTVVFSPGNHENCVLFCGHYHCRHTSHIAYQDGERTIVHILDCDGASLEENLHVMSIDEIRALAGQREQ